MHLTKKKYVIISLIFLFIFISFISADNVQSLGKVKQGNSIVLKQNCINTTYVNITSISVTGIQTEELISSPISMNLISDGYQSYNFSDTSLVGEYIITGVCDENSLVKGWSYNFDVTPSGGNFDGVAISVYIFFLLICLIITYYSSNLIIKNRLSNDKITNQQLYEIHKKRELDFYIKILKRKLWIVGVFGVYLSFLVFVALLNQLVYNLGLSDLNEILNNLFIILAWGLIPFVLFWLGYIVIYFYKSTEEILKFQFGGFRQ
jgi:hypothetical protein